MVLSSVSSELNVKKENRMVIWTVNIDRRKSRKLGRLIPRRFSIPSPSVDEIFEACKKLRLNPESHPEKRYPPLWWEKTGYVEVNRVKPKSKILIKVAEIIKERRDKK